ncbi:MAG: FAD-dependent oxidoreductase [Pirellulales bacterium]
MRRRKFLKSCAWTAGAASLPWTLARPVRAGLLGRAEAAADVVIVGGGLGGCAAALAAVRAGASVVMTEETDWIGGQLTQQAVPPDEHPWIESFGCTRSYRHLRQRIRQYYRDHYPLTAQARGQQHLNPGAGSVSRLCHEPRVALAAIESLLAPYVSSGRLTILLTTIAIAAETEGDSIRAVRIHNRLTGDERTLRGKYFLDATEQGDLLPLAGVEHVTGFESQSETGEPHAPSEAQPDNIQSCTWCFAVDHLEGEDHTIDQPAEYEFWRDYVPNLRPPWPGPLLSWSMSDPVTLGPRAVTFDPAVKPGGKGLNLWLYRRIAARQQFAEGTYPSDITLVNWPQNDYWLGNLHAVTPDEAQGHRRRSAQLSLSLLYWMQTEAPRPDGGTGWPGLRLRGDPLGSSDGLAKYPYIRESRRIKAEFTVVEQQVGTEARMEATGKGRDEVSAEPFADSVGVGSYRIDLHPSSGGDNYLDISSLPFQIPLGSLIPVRMENLLPAAKNLGVTHITNGCYRLHPVEWNIGEAAGLLAAHCLDHGLTPHAVQADDRHLADFQTRLHGEGIETRWPDVRGY